MVLRVLVSMIFQRLKSYLNLTYSSTNRLRCTIKKQKKNRSLLSLFNVRIDNISLYPKGSVNANVDKPFMETVGSTNRLHNVTEPICTLFFVFFKHGNGDSTNGTNQSISRPQFVKCNILYVWLLICVDRCHS